MKLIERIPDVGIFIGHILEFNDKEGQTVDKTDNIGAAGLMRTFDRKLIYCKEVIVPDILKINEFNRIPFVFIFKLEINRDPIQQQFVKLPVILFH